MSRRFLGYSRFSFSLPFISRRHSSRVKFLTSVFYHSRLGPHLLAVRRSNKGYTNSGTSKEKNIAIEYRYAAGRIDRLPSWSASTLTLSLRHYGQDGVLSKQQNVMCRGELVP